ncbi:MAG: ABC-2 transporter permease, partial [Lachnospiraceae bacterium]|nr:ABC-2 transporter permease [Lachnospiraceae bacterium]
MKGLLIKDLELVWHNKKLFLIMLVVMFLAFQNYDGYSFLIGYNTMIFILLILNTMTLDEYYKSMPFMMTLPVKRET